MTDHELKSLLRNTEDNFTERKTEGDHKDFLKTVVAFANSVQEDRTAVFFVGVRDDGTVSGLTNAQSTQDTFMEIFSRKCYPEIRPKPQMRVLRDGEKEYLAILITASKNRPHFGGPAWAREGHKTVVASEHLFQELIDSRTSKVAEILKWKNQTVRVESIGKRLGETKPLRDSGYRESEDCVVLSCNSHILHLHKLGSQRDVSEPLENVTITDDIGTGRLKLIVRPVR